MIDTKNPLFDLLTIMDLGTHETQKYVWLFVKIKVSCIHIYIFFLTRSTLGDQFITSHVSCKMLKKTSNIFNVKYFSSHVDYTSCTSSPTMAPCPFGI